MIEKAHKRELDSALLDLYKQFEKWKQNEIDCWELNDLIHKFHDGISRDLYKYYVMAPTSLHIQLVNRILEDKILCREDIPEEVYQEIKS